MKTLNRILFVLAITLGVVALSIFLLHGSNIAVLNPKGIIAQKELNLLIFASLLSLVVVIPVFILTFGIVWRYREGNHRAKYTPDWDHNRLAETVWWGIPIILILILAVVTWTSSHELDPYRPLASTKPPITIQVIALDWKWLFIYPGQHIASVNFLQIPTDTPINLEITSDAPMNSLWIPQLSGQIYAMAGMTSQLHLNATEAGIYRGSSANLSGNGFSGMKFNVQASSQAEYDDWVRTAQTSSNQLTMSTYDELAKPSQDTPVTLYSVSEANLYGKVVMKYMAPANQMTDMQLPTYGSAHEPNLRQSNGVQ